MSNITDRVAYLKGLAEGMKLSEETNEGKLLLKMLDALEDMAEEISALRADHDELDEYVESIDDDLADMEEYLFDDDDYDDDEDEDDEDGEEDEDEDEDDDDDFMSSFCNFAASLMNMTAFERMRADGKETMTISLDDLTKEADAQLERRRKH